jgi:hypothetical protein
MLRLRQALEAVQSIIIPACPTPVEVTVAEELELHLQRRGAVRRGVDSGVHSTPGKLIVSVATDDVRDYLVACGVSVPQEGEWIYFDLDERGTGILTASTTHFLYALFTLVAEDLIDLPLGQVRRWLRRVNFEGQRSGFDLFLNQYGRLIRPFDRRRLRA